VLECVWFLPTTFDVLSSLGTNTDGVIVDITRSGDPSTRGVIASFKNPTTPDVTTGIELAVKGVLEQSGIDPARHEILGLTIGTTVRRSIPIMTPWLIIHLF